MDDCTAKREPLLDWAMRWCCAAMVKVGWIVKVVGHHNIIYLMIIFELMAVVDDESALKSG